MPSIDEIKKELQTIPPKRLLDLTLKLARFKKENKEYLSFLLFDSHDVQGYVETICIQMDEVLGEISKGPSAAVKTKLRAVTRTISRQSRYMGSKEAAAELHLHFCETLLNHPDSLLDVSSAKTIFHQQLNKLNKIIPALNDDLQFDLQQRIVALDAPEKPARKFSRWWRSRRSS